MESKDITFKITGAELNKVNEFKKKHKESCVCKQNLTLGEYWTYSFIPTGLGNVVSIKCNLCGEQEDVTDVDNW